MNRKQRVLTIIALIAFVVIGICHRISFDWSRPIEDTIRWAPGYYKGVTIGAIMENLNTTWFMLGIAVQMSR